MRGLKRARNRPPLPWRWREHGSERPDSPDNHEAVLKTPAGSAELPHTANGAGHTASRDASNRPQHARIAGVARGEARSAATGRGGGLRAEPHATPFFPSRALGPMLSPSARELWPFSPRFRAIPRLKWRRYSPPPATALPAILSDPAEMTSDTNRLHFARGVRAEPALVHPYLRISHRVVGSILRSHLAPFVFGRAGHGEEEDGSTRPGAGARSPRPPGPPDRALLMHEWRRGGEVAC